MITYTSKNDWKTPRLQWKLQYDPWTTQLITSRQRVPSDGVSNGCKYPVQFAQHSPSIIQLTRDFVNDIESDLWNQLRRRLHHVPEKKSQKKYIILYINKKYDNSRTSYRIYQWVSPLESILSEIGRTV